MSSTLGRKGCLLTGCNGWGATEWGARKLTIHSSVNKNNGRKTKQGQGVERGGEEGTPDRGVRREGGPKEVAFGMRPEGSEGASEVFA